MARLQQDDCQGRLRGLFRGLNALGATPWAVHRRVLQVAQRVAEEENFSQEWAAIGSCWRQEEGRRALQLAEELDRDAAAPFFLPHAADFRGRAYPLLPALSPTSPSHTRALLLLHRARPLGDQGFFWLKVQLANCFGWDKLPLEERVRRVDRSLEDVRASAKDPLGTNLVYTGSAAGATVGSAAAAAAAAAAGGGGDVAWWRAAKNPWLCLAACFELDAALRHQEAGGELAHFRSRLPVMLDGSCNALQHYAALGLDAAGASMVNLAPALSLPPRDAYSALTKHVAARVLADSLVPPPPREEEDKEEKAAGGTRPAGSSQSSQSKRPVKSKLKLKQQKQKQLGRRELAGLLAGRVSDRRLFKGPLMTAVYGASPFSLRRMLRAQLRQLALVERALVPQAATYLAEVFQDCFHNQFFGKARAVQRWLAAVAEEVGQSVAPSEAPSLVYPPRLPKQKHKHRHTCRTGGEGAPEQWERHEPGGGAAGRAVYPHTRLVWTAPLSELQVHPPYDATSARSSSRSRTNTGTGTGTEDERCTLVDVKRQTRSFAPNFVHSLDAAHMLATASRCLEEDVDFASVHDCFWTHAGSATQMSAALRDEFVKLYAAAPLNTSVSVSNSSDSSNSTREATRGGGGEGECSGGGEEALFPVLQRLRREVLDRYGLNVVPRLGLTRHSRRMRRGVVFRWQDWRQICVPELPLSALLGEEMGPAGGRGGAALFNMSLVRNSTYFFH